MVDVDATLTMPFVFCPATSHVLADVRAKKNPTGGTVG
jgi:hypothetical protein